MLCAESISIQQDVRKGQLLIHFACSDQHLHRTVGVLGQCNLAEKNFGLAATGLRTGTMYIIAKLSKNAGNLMR